MRKKEIIFSICFALGMSFGLHAQNDKSEARREIERISAERENRVEQFLNSHTDVKRKIVRNNEIHVIFDVVNGQPVYRSTNSNAQAAVNIKTDVLQPGGSLNLNLEGEGMDVGIWEVGGTTLTTHVEFIDNNASSRILLPDNNSNATFHSTHVTGTIGAQGINPDAKGMAPKSNLLVYDVNSVESEVADAALDQDFLISNHSYGVAVLQDNGQTISPTIMGAYTSSARQWDLIANDAPYHLAVFAAGNSGNDEYEGGLAPNFDKLTYDKNAKNNLVVANVASVTYFGDLIISNVNSSSSRGPSDDGRVKPDIGGMGTNILSTASSANNSYGTATGTSMASPGVAGSLLLLQELYNNEFGEYLKSSTLKALALNTASDAGNAGPDATYGWGIMNTEAAALAILDKESQNSIISLQTLNNNETISFEVTADGSEDLKIMIGWNDPAGNPINNTVNSPTPALVNDLDLRISYNGETFLPWKLQLSDVTAPAIKGDNLVDNYEQVIVENPVAGAVYTIEINHKGNLVNAQQEVSVIGTGLTATTLSNEKFEQEYGMSIWPIPTKNQLNVTFKNEIAGEANASIFDITGRRVFNENLPRLTSNESFDVSNLNEGTYILRIETKQGLITKKFIKK